MKKLSILDMIYYVVMTLSALALIALTIALLQWAVQAYETRDCKPLGHNVIACFEDQR